jgi:hypothetical protein
MTKPAATGLFCLLFLLIVAGGAYGQTHHIGGCPQLKLWKNNPLFLKAQDTYNHSAKSSRINSEWQKIVSQVYQLDAEMTEFVRTCSELKARAAATNAQIDQLNRRGEAWNNRWSGRPVNASAMAEKNAMVAEANRLGAEKRARDAEWRQMKSQHASLNAKYTRLEQEIPRFTNSAGASASAAAPKIGGQPGAGAPLAEPTKPGQPPSLQRLKEAHHLNEQGSQYYLNKQWELAARAFKGALERWPDNEEIRNNYELAMDHLAAQQRRGGKGRGGKAARQLESVKYHSTAAQGLNDEAAKMAAMKGFDTPGKSVAPAVDLRGVGQRPAWPDWVKGDGKMRSLQREQNRHRAVYTQMDKELTLVRQEMQTADPARKNELAVEAAKIKAELAKAEYDIARKEKDIRQRARKLLEQENSR